MGHPRIILRNASGTVGSGVDGREVVWNPSPSGHSGDDAIYNGIGGLYVGGTRIGPLRAGGNLTVTVGGSTGANTAIIAITVTGNVQADDLLNLISTTPQGNTEYYFFIKNDASSSISVSFPHQGHTAAMTIGRGNIGEVSMFNLQTGSDFDGWVTRYSEDDW